MRKGVGFSVLIVAAGLVGLLRAASAEGQQAPPEPLPPKGVAEALPLAEVQKWTGKHPRLFFSAADLDALRARRAKKPYDDIYNAIVRRADDHLTIDPNDVADRRYQGRDQMSHILQRLAFAGLVAGERKYSRKAVRLLAALGERGFPFHGTHEDGAGDILIGLALVYDWSHDFMTTEEWSAVRRQISQLAGALNKLMMADGGYYGQLARRPGAAGHHVVALAAGGLGMASLALRGEVSRELTNAWQITADVCIRNYLRDALGADGAGLEGFDLTTYALHAVLPYVIARRQMDHVDVADGTALEKVATWTACELLPGPAMMPLGESGSKLGSEDALAALFALRPGDPAHVWFYEATHGAQGRKTFGTAEEGFSAGDVAAYLWYPGPPKPTDLADHLPRAGSSPRAGLAFVRSGWGDPAGDVVVSFHAPHRAHLGRWQMDVGQFTLYAFGAGWAVDSGPGWRVRGERGTRTRSAGSQGHNLMTFDGRDAGKPFGRMITFMDDKDWALAVGDASASYDLKTFRRYLAVGKRGGRARYVVVIDEIDPGDAELHDYVHFLHTGAGNTVEVDGRSAHIKTAAGAAGRFAVVAPRGAELSVDVFRTMVRGEHPRIEVRHKSRGPVWYVAVLVPGAKDDAQPIAVTPVEAGPGAAACRIVVGDVEDRVCVLIDKAARPPEGFGREKHRIQLTNGAFKKSLLFELREPGHDVPRPETPTPPASGNGPAAPAGDGGAGADLGG